MNDTIVIVDSCLTLFLILILPKRDMSTVDSSGDSKSEEENESLYTLKNCYC